VSQANPCCHGNENFNRFAITELLSEICSWFLGKQQVDACVANCDQMLRDSEINSYCRPYRAYTTYRKLLSSLHPTTILLTQSYTLDRKTVNINVQKTYQFKALCKDDMITLDNYKTAQIFWVTHRCSVSIRYHIVTHTLHLWFEQATFRAANSCCCKLQLSQRSSLQRLWCTM